MSWTNGQGQRFDIRLSVDDGYLFIVEQTVANVGDGADEEIDVPGLEAVLTRTEIDPVEHEIEI